MFDDQGSPTRSADRLGATADHLSPAMLPGSASIDRVFPTAPAAWPQFAKATQKRDLSFTQQRRRKEVVLMPVQGEFAGLSCRRVCTSMSGSTATCSNVVEGEPKESQSTPNAASE